MHLELAVWLNLVSTVATVAALFFTALQVRQGNIKRGGSSGRHVNSKGRLDTSP